MSTKRPSWQISSFRRALGEPIPDRLAYEPTPTIASASFCNYTAYAQTQYFSGNAGDLSMVRLVDLAPGASRALAERTSRLAPCESDGTRDAYDLEKFDP